MKPSFNYIPFLGRKIGVTNFDTFGVFLAKLSALFLHCESLVHRRMNLVVFSTKMVFKPTYIVYPKYEIGCKEFGK